LYYLSVNLSINVLLLDKKTFLRIFLFSISHKQQKRPATESRDSLQGAVYAISIIIG